MKNLVIAVLALLAIGWAADTHVHAQQIGPTSPGVVSSTGTLANCPAVNASAGGVFCYTTTGLYQSLSGGAWTLVGASAGVTSWNGQTGAVTYTPPKTATISVPASTLTGTVQ